MRENRTSGSVRGVPGNRHSYRESRPIRSILKMAWLKQIFEVFSRRDKAVSTLSHNIPNSFRNRVLLWCREAFSNRRSEFGMNDYTSDFWTQIHRYLQYRHGKVRISHNRHSPVSIVEDTIAYLVDCPGEEFLDFIEYIFRVECFSHVTLPENELVKEINELFRFDDLPYYLTDFIRETAKEVSNVHPFAGKEVTVIKTLSYPKVIMKETELVHDQAIKPVLMLLQQIEYNNANLEFLEALEDYRKGDFGDCLTKCCSAFESVMKILCKRKGWPCKQTDTASTLIKTILSKTQLENYFESLLIIVATLRNKLSKSHGAGPIQRDVPRHLAPYSINATASAILPIVEEAGEK